MKVTVKEDSEEMPAEFPKLVQFAHTNVICLMTCEDEGTIIDSPIGVEEVGIFSRGWCKDYTDFKGTITLSND